MSSVPEPTASVELSIFDALSASVTFGTGWLVEGEINVQALEQALSRVIDRWRLFAGRLQRQSDVWIVKIPLGPLPADYLTYSISTSHSEKPLSSFVSLPLVASSPVLEPSLYMPSSLPTSNEEYERRSHPLVSFHIVRFAPETTTMIHYECLGLVLPHGVVDGIGAAYLCEAIVAELNGVEWEVPPLPKEGIHKSSAHSILESESFTRLIAPPKVDPETVQEMPISGKEIMERKGRILIILPNIAKSLVEQVRKEAQSPNHITTGDVLSAWVVKTLYQNDLSTSKSVMVQSLASFRHLFRSFPELKSIGSPHNYLALLPVPLLPVSYIQRVTVAELARMFSRSRNAFCEYDVSLFYKQLTGSLPFPTGDDDANVVPLVISNASKWRLIEMDWSKIGVKETICAYRMLHEYDKAGKDAVQMIGRLPNGSIVLDTILSDESIAKLEEGLEKIKERI
ncbi:hypothetical protein GYMLUDRAFT_181795 [Collybiopsis luxurians FD-317 M1]|uniref:Alcohol acetyltransferase n=1 Tax=Collybiopsis luxurians FD-317 M1 TaxID=944289 RepID=A0A0D0C8P2_9AGAR|nr:hypothetical protein GYMLUDRAFT_181795 [Collybiopsis luxurians FD-317 M1]